MSISVFLQDDTMFCYVESVDGIISPKELFGNATDFFIPLHDLGGCFFRPMTEIFHFNMPQSREHWKRKNKPDFCFGMIARLIPSMTARYVFYHYQFQEEQPGKWDKYSRIFLSDDIAFFYGEIPEVIEPASYSGTLSTHNTPQGGEWQHIMDEHFIPWDTLLFLSSIITPMTGRKTDILINIVIINSFMQNTFLQYEKEEILEFYVNGIYYGSGHYCIYDTAKGHFNKKPIEMTEDECTLLAGIPNAPSVYSLDANPDLAKKRKGYRVYEGMRIWD